MIDLKIEKSEECKIEYTPEKSEGRLRRRFQIGIISSFIGCILFATSIISLLTREFNFYSIFTILVVIMSIYYIWSGAEKIEETI